MPNHTRLHVTAKLDRHLIGPRGGTRHVVVDLVAPRNERPDDEARPPLNLALVIDASGSMSGAPLEAARTAAIGVVEQMLPGDRITLVSFASDVILHVDAVQTDEAGCRRAIAAVRGLHPRGCTDLAGGWLEAADRVRRVMDAMPGAQHRVVVLSDGYANRGIVDVMTLQAKAAALREAGIYTSCVGIGDDYSPTQLDALAEHGGGRVHDAPLGEDIVATVMGELGEIINTFAGDVTLTVSHSPLMPVTVLGPFAASTDHGRLVISCGGLVGGARRRIVLQLAVPGGAPGDALPLVAAASYRDADGMPAMAAAQELELRVVTEAEAAAELPDLDLGREVATTWHDHVVHASTLLNADGSFEAADRLVHEHRLRLREYCRDIPGTDHLLRRLHRHRRAVSDAMPLHVSKGLLSRGKMALKLERDFRVNRR